MAVSLQYLDDLSRVRISLSGFPNGAVRVQRALNPVATDALWTTVRGGLRLPVVGGVAVLDDYEFVADVENHYRVQQLRWDDMTAIFTSSGTWNKPPGLVAVRVTAVGGGGGGGGAATTGSGQNAIGGGGGGGVTAIAWIPADDLADTETVTIGTGGSGGTAGANAGSPGGTTTFTVTNGTNVVAAGGSGGAAGAAFTVPTVGAGTPPATTGTGDVVIPGGGTAPRFYAAAGAAYAPSGGDSLFGRGGVSTGAGTGGDGVNASGYGGGGSGGRNAQSQATARAGGNGAPGLVIVEHFFDEIGV